MTIQHILHHLQYPVLAVVAIAIVIVLIVILILNLSAICISVPMCSTHGCADVTRQVFGKVAVYKPGESLLDVQSPSEKCQTGVAGRAEGNPPGFSGLASL